ncbi:MAG: hypothetical protein ACIAXF_01430 [Phycisphaerales bacterium JB063]
MARRSDIPPYEIMRQRAADKAAAASGPAAASDPPTPVGAGPSPWWVGATVPIVLRIPRGLAVLSILGLLLLVMLAYWVGTARGRSAAQQQIAQGNPDAAVLAGPRGVGRVSITSEQDAVDGPGASQAGDGGPSPQQVVQTTFEERRERGLNYFRLVKTSREEGEQIAAFMAQAQIDIQLVLEDNERSCVVYAVERGFRGDELNSDARRQHESHLRALGNQWKQLGSGHSNFGTMIPERYSGPGSG